MKIVVLDTNALVRDWHFDAPSLSSLLDLARRSELRVVIPEVVVLELVNKYREELIAVRENLKKSTADLGRLGLAAAIPDLETDEAAERYEAWVRGHLSNARVQVPAVPDVSHRDLLMRVLERKRPFGNSDRGYRDALIWESVLALGDKGVHFVSADNGFYEGTRLHQDLIPAGWNSILSGYKSVSAFLEGHLTENKGALRALEEALRESDFNLTVADRLATAAAQAGLLETDARGDARYDFDLFELPEGADSPSVDTADAVSAVDVESARSVGENRYLVDLTLKLALGISFYAYKSDAYGWQGSSKSYIIDPDWNEHMVLCRVVVERKVSFEARWTPDDADVEDIQLTSIY